MRTPYVGITGFMSSDEVRAALDAFDIPGRQLMVGVLASSKTLSGEGNRHPGRYPQVGAIEGIFGQDARALNLVHYATDDRTALSAELVALAKYTASSRHGLQLNIAWPDPDAPFVDLLHSDMRASRIVLQLSGRAIGSLMPREVALNVSRYQHYITDVLIDTSVGRGLPLDVPTASRFLAAIAVVCPWVGLGVAGGLCAETLPRIRLLLERFPNLSFDAEGRLRDEDDHLDLSRVRDYLAAAREMLTPKTEDKGEVGAW